MANSTSELRLDTDVLASAGTALRTISDDFDGANDRGREVAGLLGPRWLSSEVDDLAKAIRDFDTKWDDRRGKLKEGIDALATATSEIARIFDETDKALADALEPS